MTKREQKTTLGEMRSSGGPRLQSVAQNHQFTPKFGGSLGILLTVQSDSRSFQRGRTISRGVTMREEFASYGFLAVTVASLVLLCSGLLSLAFT